MTSRITMITRWRSRCTCERTDDHCFGRKQGWTRSVLHHFRSAAQCMYDSRQSFRTALHRTHKRDNRSLWKPNTCGMHCASSKSFALPFYRHKHHEMEDRVFWVPLLYTHSYVHNAPMCKEKDQEMRESNRTGLDSIDRYDLQLESMKGYAFPPAKNLRFPHSLAISPRNTLWFDICG